MSFADKLILGDDYVIEEHARFEVIRRKDVPADAILDAVRQHREHTYEGNVHVIKQDVKTQVSRVVMRKFDGSSAVVKHYPHRGIFRSYIHRVFGHPAERCFNGYRHLERAGFHVPPVYAFVSKMAFGGVAECLLLMQDVHEWGEEFDRLFYALVAAGEDGRFARTKALTSLAHELRRLHEARIVHGDLKTCNITIELRAEGDYRIGFLDWDDVRFGVEIDEEIVARSFAQIHASLPGSLPVKDRIRFAQEYFGVRKLERWHKRILLHSDEIARAHKIVYVTREGDKIETWSR
ncbi:MAG: lipopolysaccharide kinase InaA family protein [Planctomycetes bacterium]|nr:lipopolysaccharide kinase InaA family protein [Planctomycetota bacterium]